MTPKDFQNELAHMVVEIKRWVDSDAPRILGKVAVDIYTRNFQREGFLNNGMQPWQDVKRRINRVKGAAGSRKILTGETGNLGRSFSYVAGKGEVTIYNDAQSAGGFPYGKVHNEGASDAGRSRNVVIPKRQIIGESTELDRECQMEIERKLNSLFKK